MEVTKQNFQTPPCFVIPVISLLKGSLYPGEVLGVAHSLVLFSFTIIQYYSKY